MLNNLVLEQQLPVPKGLQGRCKRLSTCIMALAVCRSSRSAHACCNSPCERHCCLQGKHASPVHQLQSGAYQRWTNLCLQWSCRALPRTARGCWPRQTCMRLQAGSRQRQPRRPTGFWRSHSGAGVLPVRFMWPGRKASRRCLGRWCGPWAWRWMWRLPALR